MCFRVTVQQQDPSAGALSKSLYGSPAGLDQLSRKPRKEAPAPVAWPSPFANGKLRPVAAPASKNPRREKWVAALDWRRSAMRSRLMIGLPFSLYCAACIVPVRPSSTPSSPGTYPFRMATLGNLEPLLSGVLGSDQAEGGSIRMSGVRRRLRSSA